MGVLRSGGRAFRDVGMRIRLALVAAAVCTAVTMAAPAAFAQDPFTFAGGSLNDSAPNPYYLTFNPAGTLLAVVNVYNPGPTYSISMFSADANGKLQAVDGSPFPVDTFVNSVAFNASGTLMAAALPSAHGFAIYSVGASGALSLLSTQQTVDELTLPLSVAFGPSGNLLAVAYTGANTVATYTVASDGSVTQVGVGQTGTATNPQTVAFSPSGNLIATANANSNDVSVFSVASDGSLTSVGSFSTGDTSMPLSATFSPNGALLATANQGTETVSVFSVATDGTLSQIPHSPFEAFTGVDQVTFNPSGSLLAVVNHGVDDVQLFTVGAQGTLTLLQDIDQQFGALSAAFSPSGGVLAIADFTINVVLTYKVGAPSVTFTFPGPDETIGTSAQEIPVHTIFSCKDAPDAPGISSCVDQNGNPSLTNIDLSALGPHTFTVTATSRDGQITTSSINYTVIPGPTATISSPAPGGVYAVGQLVPTGFNCDAAGGGPTIVICVDSNGKNGDTFGQAHISGTGALDTSTVGLHTYKVVTCAGSFCVGGSGDASITYTVSAAPTASIAVPVSGGVYAQGRSVATSFSCSASGSGPTIVSCIDAGGSSSPSPLDTTTVGPHTFTVTATASDGQKATASVTYTVVRGPSALILSPLSGGTYTVGQSVTTAFSCADGAGAPGIASCTDSNGSSGSSGHLDTSSAGAHTYAVTATSVDGATAAASITYIVSKTAQAITFTSMPAVPSEYGGRYTVTAAGGGSGNPVTLSIDSASAGACSIAGGVVAFTGVGSCVIDANQAGNELYDAAPQARQTVIIGKAVVTVTALDQSKAFGAAVPALTATIAGFVTGESLATSGITGSASCATSATGASLPGTYPIACTQGSLASGHYSFAFVAGTLTVTFTQTLTSRQGGSLTIASGDAVLLGPDAVVTGSVTVDAGGVLHIVGAQVTGLLRVSGASEILICGATIGPVEITGNTGLTMLGSNDGASCAGNVTGPVRITGNSGPVVFDGNNVNGQLTITDNMGTVEALANTVTGKSTIQP